MAREEGKALTVMMGFQEACVLGAAAELGIFTAIKGKTLSLDEVCWSLGTDVRATGVLLDALASMKFLEKKGGKYKVPSEFQKTLIEDSPKSVLPMVWHRMGMMRSWSQLAEVVKNGKPAVRQASIRGAAADRAAFIGAMHTINVHVADSMVNKLGKLSFRHLLDVGGASGTWTLALLKKCPKARATIFDLPDAVEQAKSRVKSIPKMGNRIDFVAGDFYHDALPKGADFVWVSAIIHQHSRLHNRELFTKVFMALESGGTIAIRDIVMEDTRTRPAMGALFAVNMLVGTETGGTFTASEIAEDLSRAGFTDVKHKVKSQDMSSIVTAVKP